MQIIVKLNIFISQIKEENRMERIMCVVFMILIQSGHAADDQMETVVVSTPTGPMKGVKTKNKQTGETLHEFRGIPYGKPPVGELRFEKPKPIDNWKETLDATSFGAACPQSVFIPDFKPGTMSEDCLFLNVYVPQILDPNRKLSVMVWIHGGGLNIGFSHQYDGGWIATEGNAIVVTINYRLDIFGFLALDHPVAKGNYGLWDQKLALQWVHDNIAAFGGNPDSVTIFGESAGGWSSSFQSLIPSNKGLFQRVIAQSGVVTRTNMLSRERIKEVITDLTNKTSCQSDDMVKFINCLRKMTVEDLLMASNIFASMPDDRFILQGNYLPVVDGELYTDHPINKLEDKMSDVSLFFKSLDFMTGTTSNEGSLVLMMAPSLQEHYKFNITEGIPSRFVCKAIINPFVKSFFNDESDVKQKMCEFYTVDTGISDQSMRATDIFSDIVFGYPTFKMLEYHTSTEGNTFHYLFSKTNDLHFGGPKPIWFKGCGHGEEVMYMFDIGTLLPSLESSELSAKDKEFSKRVIQYWTSFAKSGWVWSNIVKSTSLYLRL